jgi:hypothetical protein
MLRTRRTIARHLELPQFRMTKEHRFCHCSQHPWGIIVNRRTRLRHRAQDADDRIDEDNLDPDQLHEYLADPENVDATRAGIRQEVLVLRNRIWEAQFDFDNTECDEYASDQAIDPERDQDEEDPEQRDLDEVMEDLESTLLPSEEPIGFDRMSSCFIILYTNTLSFLSES